MGEQLTMSLRSDGLWDWHNQNGELVTWNKMPLGTNAAGYYVVPGARVLRIPPGHPDYSQPGG